MKKLCIASFLHWPSALLMLKKLILLSSAPAAPASLPPSWQLSKARKLLFSKKCRSSAETLSAVRAV